MTRYGFIRDKLELKILILFVLSRLPAPIDLDSLAELVLCDNGITYFDFIEALGELVSTNHVVEEDGYYVITDKGFQDGAVTESSVPYSVRIKAEQSAQEMAKELRRKSMIKATHTERENGITVSLSLSDGLGDIINMDILAGSEKQAVIIENNFKKNAEHIYNAVVKILLSEDLCKDQQDDQQKEQKEQKEQEKHGDEWDQES